MSQLNNPYKKFFPLGTLFALIGGGVWLFKSSDFYPKIFHSWVMMGAFLFSFVAGFLMTAVPKMMQSFSSQKYEVYFLWWLIVASFVASIFEYHQLFFILELLCFLFLIYFGLSRLDLKNFTPPAFFILVLFGVFSGIIGSLLLIFDSGSSIGHNLFFNGVLLFLVLGVGSRLIPALRGLTALDFRFKGKAEILEFIVLGIIILLSLIFESLGEYVFFFGLLKGAAVLVVAIFHWRVFDLSLPTSRLGYGVWISAWMVLVGIFLKIFFPAYGLHWVHLTYIGGFGMMTFTIASRVVISHGGYDLNFEKKSIIPLLIILFFILAAISRALVFYFEDLMLLKLAALFWVMGVLIWGFVFIPRCFGIKAS